MWPGYDRLPALQEAVGQLLNRWADANRPVDDPFPAFAAYTAGWQTRLQETRPGFATCATRMRNQ